MRMTHSLTGYLALAAAATMLGCGQTNSDENQDQAGGTRATGGTPATGGAETGGVHSVVVPPASAGGAGGAEVTLPTPPPETTFRIVNDTNATIYVQLPTSQTLMFTVSGEYNGTPDWGDDAPFCMDCPRDTCPLYEQPLRTVEAIEPGDTWERVWDSYLFALNDENCIEKKTWRGNPHDAEILLGHELHQRPRGYRHRPRLRARAVLGRRHGHAHHHELASYSRGIADVIPQHGGQNTSAPDLRRRLPIWIPWAGFRSLRPKEGRRIAEPSASRSRNRSESGSNSSNTVRSCLRATSSRNTSAAGDPTALVVRQSAATPSSCSARRSSAALRFRLIH